jgi:hypothetical protein
VGTVVDRQAFAPYRQPHSQDTPQLSAMTPPAPIDNPMDNVSADEALQPIPGVLG